MDFECQSEKGGDPASGLPPSLPAGELLDGDGDGDGDGTNMSRDLGTLDKAPRLSIRLVIYFDLAV